MFGKKLTHQKIAHKIVKPYVYKALREGLKTHDNGKIQNLRGFDSLSLRRSIVTMSFLGDQESIESNHMVMRESHDGKVRAAMLRL